MKRFIADPNVGVILLTQEASEKFVKLIVQSHNEISPVILEIPSKEMRYDPKKDIIMQRAHRLLFGTDIAWYISIIKYMNFMIPCWHSKLVSVRRHCDWVDGLVSELDNIITCFTFEHPDLVCYDTASDKCLFGSGLKYKYKNAAETIIDFFLE